MNPCISCGTIPTRLFLAGPLCDQCKPATAPDQLPFTGPTRRPPERPVDQYAIDLAQREGKLRPQPPDLAACPERAKAVQCPATHPRIRTCACCGRITARLDGDGIAWCGGNLPVQHERAELLAATS